VTPGTEWGNGASHCRIRRLALENCLHNAAALHAVRYDLKLREFLSDQLKERPAFIIFSNCTKSWTDVSPRT
jgi:hypothetical protein